MHALAKPLLIASCVLAMSLTSAYSSSVAKEAGATVTLSAVRQPLPSVLRDLSQQAGLHLEAERDLQAQKLVIVVRERPVHEVMDQLARLLGARWVRRESSSEGGDHYLLERQPVTKEWLRAWREARVVADAAAREEQAKFVRQFIGDVLAKIDDPVAGPPQIGGTLDVDLARFLKTLPPAVLDRVAKHVADTSPVRDRGRALPAAPPVTFRFTDLGPEQQRALQTWLANRARPGDYHVQFLAALPETRIAITSTDGVAIDVQLFAPFRPDPGTFTVCGSSYSGAKLEGISNELLRRQIAARKTPAEVLLGAQLQPDGLAVPAVQLTAATGMYPAIDLTQEAPLRWRLLEQLATVGGLNVIADHYTLASRLPRSGSRLDDLLAAAATAYRSVFRYDGTYVLARRISWPDDDLGEIPAPLPERWIDHKEAAKDAKDRALPFEDLLALAACTDAQIDALAAYQDVARNVSFAPEEAVVRSNPSQRRLLFLLARLPRERLRELRGNSGLAVDTLPRELRQEILERVPDPVRRLVVQSRLQLQTGTTRQGVPTVGLVVVRQYPGAKTSVPLAVLALLAPAL